MEINFSDDASKLNDSFAPEEGIFSGGSDLDSVLITEFTDSTGFCLPDIVAGLIGCIPVEIAMILGIIVGLLSV